MCYHNLVTRIVHFSFHQGALFHYWQKTHLITALLNFSYIALSKLSFVQDHNHILLCSTLD